MLNDGLPGAAVGPPPKHLRSCISTEETVLGGDFGITFKSASSVSLWWSKM